MVNKFDSKSYKPWRPVARPVPKTDRQLLLQQQVLRAPPSIPPKPNGSVYVYVYEAPGSKPGTYQTLTRSGSIPANAQLVIGQPAVTNNGPVKYPYSNELIPTYGRKTPEVRIKERSKKVGKGYKLMAEANPRTLRSSSKGGRMFINQKKRMEKYTSLAAPGKKDEGPENQQHTSVEDRATPWNIAKESQTAVKYIPSQIYRSDLSKDLRGHRSLLAPVPQPPPEWRAKVEAGYTLEDVSPIHKVPRRWNVEDSYYQARNRMHGYVPTSPPNQADNRDPYLNGDYYEADVENNNGQSPYFGVNIPAASLGFNARAHRLAPHRKQGALTGRGTFVTTPHCQLDFNARAVGWSQAFASQY